MKQHLIKAGMILLIAVLMSGCAAALVGAGAGTVAYLRGDLEATMSQDLNAVYEASLQALGQLEIVPSQKEKDALTAKIVARGADDKKIQIMLKRTEENLTKLSIRIGIVGSETKSRVIYEQIKKNL